MYGKVYERKKIKRKKKWESSKATMNEGGGREKGRSREANKEQSNSME